jgi:hypothetical protein
MKWFGRDPATVVAQIVSAVIALVVLLPNVTEGVAATIAALATAIGGLVVAAFVRRDGQLAAIVGVGKAGIALIVLLGVPWTSAYQALLLVAIEQVASLFVRDRVEAPVTSEQTVKRGLRAAA